MVRNRGWAQPRGWRWGCAAAIAGQAQGCTVMLVESSPWSGGTTAELGFQDTIFCNKIGDNLLLATLEPAGDHRDEHV
jgi:hypothetical protein